MLYPLTPDELFKARDNVIRVREIAEERTTIVVGQLRALDAIIEESGLARELAPQVERLLAENGRLVAENQRLARRVAELEART